MQWKKKVLVTESVTNTKPLISLECSSSVDNRSSQDQLSDKLTTKDALNMYTTTPSKAQFEWPCMPRDLYAFSLKDELSTLNKRIKYLEVQHKLSRARLVVYIHPRNNNQKNNDFAKRQQCLSEECKLADKQLQLAVARKDEIANIMRPMYSSTSSVDTQHCISKFTSSPRK